MSRAGSEQWMILNPSLNKLLVMDGKGETLVEFGVTELKSILLNSFNHSDLIEEDCLVVIKKEAKPIIKEVKL